MTNKFKLMTKTTQIRSCLRLLKLRKFSKIFALTKFGTDWFVKNGFTQMNISDLPIKRQKYFNHDRNSSIFFKEVI